MFAGCDMPIDSVVLGIPTACGVEPLAQDWQPGGRCFVHHAVMTLWAPRLPDDRRGR
jgi:hypothetical protein